MRPPSIESQVSLASISLMDHAEKGQRYARIFRKAGTFLGKGNIARAIEVLKEGIEIARSLGDESMARRFEEDLRRAEQSSGDSH